jgi:nucleotide-binding universal stress UspA family protein
MVHVGEAAFPDASAPEGAGWTWERRAVPGDPDRALPAAAQGWDPDLVVMATEGRHGFMDAVRGSTTERVLRAIPCPLLAVPVSARLPRIAWSA